MRPSVRPITASTTKWNNTRNQAPRQLRGAHRAFERARRAHASTLDVISHLTGSSPESFHIHPWSSSWRTLFDSFLPFYFYLFLHSELYSELDNPFVMESLCYSANKESEDANDVSTSPSVIGACLASQGKRRTGRTRESPIFPQWSRCVSWTTSS